MPNLAFTKNTVQVVELVNVQLVNLAPACDLNREESVLVIQIILLDVKSEEEYSVQDDETNIRSLSSEEALLRRYRDRREPHQRAI